MGHARMAKSDSYNLIWIDLEMNGLENHSDSIIEDRNRGHGQGIECSRLRAGARDISTGVGARRHGRLEPETARLLWATRAGARKFRVGRRGRGAHARVSLALVPPGASPMCGNSICQDRRFLAREMPALERFFHYRNLDVSTLKELARRWAPHVADSFVKEGAHLALADILESIRELKHYRGALFAAAYACG